MLAWRNGNPVACDGAFEKYNWTPRPDFIDRCEPMIQNIPLTSLSTVAICTQPDWNLVQEGFRTFPSGHLATVFTGMTIAALNFAARLQTFDNRNNSFKVFITILPWLIAACVASTRVSDNRHFLKDIIAGAFIGTCIDLSSIYSTTLAYSTWRTQADRSRHDGLAFKDSFKISAGFGNSMARAQIGH